MTQDVMDMPPQEQADDEAPDSVPVPGALIPHLGECALLLDIDGTLLDLAPMMGRWLSHAGRELLDEADALIVPGVGSLDLVGLLFGAEPTPSEPSTATTPRCSTSA